MALSEDAIAIVASNLVAAHCSIGPKFTNETPDEEIADFVAGLFASYGKHIEAGTISHLKNSLPPAKKADGATDSG